MLMITLIYLWFITVSNAADTCTNVAAGKQTGFNTIAGLHGVSGGTANGITNGKSYNEGGWSQCVHTSDWKTNPFVYVDLGSVYKINRVTIESGPEYTLGWSGNMKIVVSDTILDSVSKFAAATVCTTVPSTGFTVEFGVDEFFCDKPISGRYVGYIVEGDRKIVCFCETQVFTTDCSKTQPALNSFEKAGVNGWYPDCSNRIQPDGVTFETCAQACLDYGDQCGGFEKYKPEDRCYIFTKPLSQLSTCSFSQVNDCEKYDRKEKVDQCKTLNCNDNDPCTDDSCDTDKGCINTPKNCDDGDKCTIDSCDSALGGCQNKAINCDDGNMCTNDSCDPKIGCINTPKNCDDGDKCTDDTCDTTKGCINTPKCPLNKVCDASSGNCKRDCTAFKIDEFLVDCSKEFKQNENDISTLDANIVSINKRCDGLDANINTINGKLTTNDANIKAINGRLDGLDTSITKNNGRLDGLDAAIVTINNRLSTNDGDITSIKSRLNAIETDKTVTDKINAINNEISTIKQDIKDMKFALNLYKAHSEGSIANVINDKNDNPESFISGNNNNKDTLIICLLILNILTIIGGVIACILLSKSKNRKYSKYENVNPYSSADENEQLQS